MSIVAAGAANYRLPLPVICSYIWSGNSYTNGSSTNISTAGNWLGGVTPSATDNVVFGDRGGVGVNLNPTNVVVASNFEVASFRFAQEMDADTNRYHNVEILSGATLKVTGTGGFSMLRDLKGVNRRQEVTFSGGGTLMVSNPVAKFSMLIDFNVNNTLDMQRLDNLYIDVSRIPLGDYRAYPNFFTNGYAGAGTTAGIHQSEPSRFVPLVDLAKTNFIRATFVDPNNYNDLGQRDYSFTIGNYSEQGSTTGLRFRLGLSNAFYMDSMCFGQALQGSASTYSFLHPVSSNSIAVFRGPSGGSSRMSVLALADAASPAAPRAANTRGTLNLSNGKVDAKIDRLFLAVDRTNNLSQMSVEGTLTIADGTFDVNNAFIGYQRSGVNLGAAAATGFAGPRGDLNVNSNANSAGATFIVNQTMDLGHTTAPTPGGTTSAERCQARVIITGGTLMASNIVVGGVTKLSTNNFITVTSGRLIVTNAIGSADGRLATLTLSGSSVVTLHGVKVGETNIFVNNFVASDTGVKFVNIPSIAGVGSYPVTVPLISYNSVTAQVFNKMAIIPPPGTFIKSVVDNTANQTIDVTFTDEPPIVVVWRGYTNNVWDVSTKNWVTQSGGVVTNFSEGFSVVFDDTVGAGPTAIDIPGAVTPGQVASSFGIVVSNQNYTFNAGGTVLGASTLKKAGTGNLTINAAFSPGVTLTSGALAGTGTVGPTTLESGTTMTAFTGTINGGLIADGATVTVAGPVNGGLGLVSGSLVNSNTISGTVSIATGTTLDNRPGALMNVNLPYTVATNATLINNGVINHIGTINGNQGLNVDGTLKGVGTIYQLGGTQLSSDVRVTVRAGGNLMIGNTVGEITNMTIAVRLDVNAGSHTVIDVDNTGTPVNDKIILSANPNGFGKVNFGVGNNLGGTIVINRTAGPAFGLGTVINMFDQTSNTPDNQNQAVPGFIPSPGAGLVWDTSQILTNLTLVVTNQPALTNVFDGTNYVFTWPESLRGWRLERQNTTLAVGIEANNSTNWVTVASSLGGTNLYYPDTNNLSEFYFRSVQPVSVNDEAVFYRMNYP